MNSPDALNVESHGGILRPPSVSLLPSEILSDIFLLLPRIYRSAESEYGCSIWKVWVIIPQVCRRWRQVVLSTPKFWSYIDLWFSRKAIEMRLERSRTAWLTVRATDLHFEVDIAKYELILKDWPRIYELEILNTRKKHRHLEKVHALLRSKSGVLRKLTLKTTSDRYFKRSYNDSIDCSDIIRAAPSLAFLHLDGFSFDWSTCNLTNLTELSLISLTPGPQSRLPTFKQILTVLATSSNLEILKLVDAGPLEVLPEDFDNPIVKLSKLREFILIRAGVDVCFKMAQVLELPNSVKWNVRCSEYPIATPVIIYPRLSTPRSVCKTLRLSINIDNVTIESSTCALEVFEQDYIPYDMRLVVDYSIHDSESWQIFDFLRREIGECDCAWKEAPRVEVVISSVDVLLTDSWIALLTLFVNLQALACNMNMRNYDASTEEALAEALMHSTTSCNVICPNLKSIELYSANFSTRKSDFTTRLCNALKYRKSHDAPLRKLRIEHANKISAEDVARLREVAGEVEWDEEEISDDVWSYGGAFSEEEEDYQQAMDEEMMYYMDDDSFYVHLEST